METMCQEQIVTTGVVGALFKYLKVQVKIINWFLFFPSNFLFSLLKDLCCNGKFELIIHWEINLESPPVILKITDISAVPKAN